MIRQGLLVMCAMAVPMTVSLKICWDLIFRFLKDELDRLGCPGQHVAHTAWAPTAARLMSCDTPSWQQEPAGSTFIRAYELVVLEPKGWFWSQTLLVLVVPLCILLHAGAPGLSRWERLSFCGVGFLGAISTSFVAALAVLASASSQHSLSANQKSARHRLRPRGDSAGTTGRTPGRVRGKSPARGDARGAGADAGGNVVVGRSRGPARVSILLAGSALASLACVWELAPPSSRSREIFVGALIALHVLLILPCAEASSFMAWPHPRPGAAACVPARPFLVFVGVIGAAIHLHALAGAMSWSFPPTWSATRALIAAFASNSCQYSIACDAAFASAEAAVFVLATSGLDKCSCLSATARIAGGALLVLAVGPGAAFAWFLSASRFA